jgi:hypothetical protein
MAQKVWAPVRVRDFLFDLDHSEIAFSKIVVKGNAEVVQEGQDRGFVFVKPVEQVLRWRLFGTASLFGGWGVRWWIGLEPLAQNRVIPLCIIGETRG